MMIKQYTVDDTGGETFEGECALDDCFEVDDPEYQVALSELDASGRYWCGGGAAVLFLLVRAG
jgi:hypothetical protein